MERAEEREDTSEAARIAAALHDPTGWPRPPEGFAARCLERIADGYGACHSPRRGLKVAASVAAMASFVGFAAYLAEKTGLFDDEGGEEAKTVEVRTESVSATTAADEPDVISEEGGNTMIVRKMVGVVGAAVV